MVEADEVIMESGKTLPQQNSLDEDFRNDSPVFIPN
ncbi:hypothetical protein SAMN05421755_10053 [Nitrosomonas sp. Nm33]|nr:hypothetical protein SAMN05421755_10053 [Nitrosomonas sp. Nm33]